MSTLAPAPLRTPSAAKSRRGLRVLMWLGIGLVVVSAIRVITGADNLTSVGTIAAALGLTVPIAMAALGGLWAERAGVVNIGLEGMMIIGTLGAGWAGYQWGPWAGVFAAVAMGLIGGTLHAIATVIFAVDHVVSGVAINILGAGAAQFLAAALFNGVPGGGDTQSPRIPEMPTITLPWISDAMSTINKTGTPVIADLAGIIGGLTTRMSYVTVLALLLVAASFWVMWRTPFGLRLRSAGEAPYAAESLGVKVMYYKFIAVMISGGFAGLGGAYLAVIAAQTYREGQTGGRGYIGLAAMIFGNWRPGGLMAGSAVFGYTDALQLRGGESVHALLLLAAAGLLVYAILAVRRRAWVSIIVLSSLIVGAVSAYLFTDELPSQASFVAPYLVTLLVLALATQKLRMPAADGKVYIKGQER